MLGCRLCPLAVLLTCDRPLQLSQTKLTVSYTFPRTNPPITKLRCLILLQLRTKEEAANALNLNNIPFIGAQLRVGRPSKYSGPTTPHGNWEDILAKYMSGELSLPSQQQQAAAGGDGAKASAAATTGGPPSKVVELRNMLTNEDLQDESEYNDILADTREECSQFGTLSAVIIPRATEPGATKIFLEYASVDDAAKAIQGLAGRTFDGRKVEAAYFDETKFANKEF